MNKSLLWLIVMLSFMINVKCHSVEIINDKVCFTKQEELKLRKISEEHLILEQLSVKKTELIDEKVKEINNLNNKIENNKYYNYVFFIGGVITSGFAIYLGSKVR